jgi:hypothetical protein
LIGGRLGPSGAGLPDPGLTSSKGLDRRPARAAGRAGRRGRP